jgi:hypothetical protein
MNEEYLIALYLGVIILYLVLTLWPLTALLNMNDDFMKNILTGFGRKSAEAQLTHYEHTIYNVKFWFLVDAGLIFIIIVALIIMRTNYNLVMILIVYLFISIICLVYLYLIYTDSFSKQLIENGAKYHSILNAFLWLKYFYIIAMVIATGYSIVVSKH